MGSRFLRFSAASVALLVRSVLAGLSQLAFCHGLPVTAAVAACILAFAPDSAVPAAWGAAVASLWPLLRQRDRRLLVSGWYGVNGAMTGLWVAWLMPSPVVMALTVTAGALACAVILDAIVYRLGDAPLGLPPLTIPFMLVAALIGQARPALYDGYESLARRVAPASADVAAGDLMAAWRAYQGARYGEAAALFRRVSEGGGGVVTLGQAQSGLGWVALMTRRADDAAVHFETALAQAPATPFAREGLGWARLGQRRAEDSERIFLALLHADPASRSGLQGLADARRLLLVQGHPRPADPAEWPAVLRMLGWKPGLLLLLLAAVWVEHPGKAAAGAGAVALGIGASLALAGPCALLWIDLHLQTMALAGMAAGAQDRFRPALLAAALLAAAALWIASHGLGHWIPLLPFNLVGLCCASRMAKPERAGRALRNP